MENSTKTNWKLGAFVAAGLAVLTFFIFYIGKNKNLFSPTITLTSLFKDVSGVTVGNNVRLAGIKIGTVTDIQIVNDSMARVYTIVDKDAQKYIHVDSKMSIGSEGLMGDKVINIQKGTPDTTLVKDGAVLPSVQPFDTGKLLVSFQNTLTHAEVLTGQMAILSRKLNSSKGTIGRLLNDSSFANHVDRTMYHLENATAGLSDNMEAAKHSFLFRGYFKKKEKERQEKKEERAEKKQQEQDEKEKRKEEKKEEKEKRKEEKEKQKQGNTETSNDSSK